MRSIRRNDCGTWTIWDDGIPFFTFLLGSYVRIKSRGDENEYEIKGVYFEYTGIKYLEVRLWKENFTALGSVYQIPLNDIDTIELAWDRYWDSHPWVPKVLFREDSNEKHKA